MSEPAQQDAKRPACWLDLPEHSIVYRDETLVVVDKPAGVPCQSPDASQPEDLRSLLIRRLARERNVPESEIYLGTHQRLDQDTSGVLLYSLDRTANAALAEQFQTRSIEKRYLAAVSGRVPKPGTLLEHWLAPGANGTMRVARPHEAGAKLARTRVLEATSRGERSLVTLAIETGRTHQIRVQLAACGSPVAGDPLYGGAPALRLLLHSQQLGFQHPLSGQPTRVETNAPVELTCWLAGGSGQLYDDPVLLRRALELSFARRVALLRPYESGETTAFRGVNGAADGFDDVYVDVYDRWLVVRVDHDARDDRERDERALLASLADFGFEGAYVKRHPRQANEVVDLTDDHYAPGRPAFGHAAPPSFLVHERGVPFEVQLDTGLRTGLFLDQRDNRALMCELAPGKRVLNLFGYTGSFSVAALVAGATQVCTVDVSRAALAWAARNVERVAATDRHRAMAEDAFVALRSLHTRGRQFDCIVLDPPSYSTSKRGRFRVTKDYPALCTAALRVLAPGGILIACVNHRGVSFATLRSFVRAAASAAGCKLDQLREQPVQRDFPVSAGASPTMKSVIARIS